MANEVSLFNSSTNVDLSYLNEVDDSLTKKLAGSVSGKRISVRGSVFRMMVSGQEVAKSPDRHLHVVIVDSAEHVSRAYYKGQYQEGVTTAPTCWSNDGVSPDSKCTTPQNSNCVNCPMNAKGSGQGESKACRHSQRLAVVLANDLQGNVYNMTLAATSIFPRGDDAHMGLQQYARKLAGHGLPPNAVVTKMQFDLDSSTPKLVFSAERPLNGEEYKIVVQQGKTEDARLAIAPPSYNTVQERPQANTPLFNSPVPEVQSAATEEVTEEEPVKREKPAAPKVASKDIDSILADWDDD